MFLTLRPGLPEWISSEKLDFDLLMESLGAKAAEVQQLSAVYAFTICICQTGEMTQR